MKTNAVRLHRCVGVAVVALVASGSACGPTAVKTDPSHRIQAQLAMSGGLDSVLVRSCGDCHSNTPSGHWSTRIVPFSWIMAKAAKDGRKVVNFDEWSTYPAELQRAFLLAACADAKKGKMPVGSYVRFRGEAKLSARDIDAICSASATSTVSASPHAH